MIMESLLLLIRKYHADGTLSLSELGRHCGCSRQNIHQILVGKRAISLPLAEKIADFFELEFKLIPKQNDKKRSA